MATLREWLAGRRDDGSALPIDKVNKYRAAKQLPSLPPAPAPQSPPLLTQGVNFAAAMAKWAAAGCPLRTPEAIEKRLRICQSCPYYVQRHCTLCGCACTESVTFLNKLAVATEVCPDGRWI